MSYIKAYKSGLDPDAEAFLIATQITDDTIKNSIDKLVKKLKKNNLWDKMKAIYPFVGGTSTTHKFNLKNPQDTDAAFRLSFQGGWTHSATGALPNGTNSYADTFFQGNNVDINNQSMSYYSISETSSSGFRNEIGYRANYRNNIGIFRTYNGPSNRAVSDISNLSLEGTAILDNNTNSKGFYIANRQSEIINKLYKNGQLVATNTNNWGITNSSSLHYYIGAENNNNTAGAFSNRECAFSHIGDSFTDAESNNLYTIIQEFQTILNRNV